MKTYRAIDHSQSRMQKLTEKDLQALIIDDEADICFLLKNILKHADISAAIVNSLEDADNFLHDNDPRMIFLDNYLSDGLGIDYIRHIKKEHPDTWVIMITAHDNETDRVKAYKEGADFFISKPFTRSTILEAVNYIDMK